MKPKVHFSRSVGLMMCRTGAFFTFVEHYGVGTFFSYSVSDKELLSDMYIDHVPNLENDIFSVLQSVLANP